MHAADSDDRLAFAPPPPPGLLRAFVLAIIAHLLLLLALSYGVRWQRETPVVAAEAELWSQLPQEAAPKVEPMPPAPPPPVVKAPPLPDPQVQRDAEIALERERQKRVAAEQRQAELERERDRKRKLDAQRKREEELARKQQEKQEKKLAQLREENLKRNLAMAGTGSPSSTGTAARSSGPSASWGGMVQRKVRPNIVFTEDIPGNPEAVVAVRLAPDGTIVSKRIKKSSGNKGWDDAVLRALDKTEVLPRDTDGRVPPEGDLVFKPKG
jgi:colicin import membrane protein